MSVPETFAIDNTTEALRIIMQRISSVLEIKYFFETEWKK